jgi:putative spermidine/putrescine transport system permease protein
MMAAATTRPPGGRLGRTVLWAFCLLVVLFLLAPIAVIVVVSFNDAPNFSFPPEVWSLRWYRALVASEGWRRSAWLSFALALGVMAASVALGAPAAYALARGRFAGRRAVEFFLVSPMVVPTIVLALGLYLLFAPFRLVGTPWALLLGHIVLALPVVLVIVGAAFRRADPAMELAARACGAGFWRAFWHVALPAVRPALVSAAAFAFLTSFDEVVLALFLGGPNATTLPKRIWEAVKFELDPSLTAISSLLVLLTLLALLIGEAARRGRANAAMPRPEPTGDDPR